MGKNRYAKYAREHHFGIFIAQYGLMETIDSIHVPFKPENPQDKPDTPDNMAAKEKPNAHKEQQCDPKNRETYLGVYKIERKPQGYD